MIAHQLIERYAIKCARGNNGGEWATHYTEEQKNFWRKFVRDLLEEALTTRELLEEVCTSGTNLTKKMRRE